MRTYLDHNATAPLRPEASAAMAEAMATGGNPSSVHADGRAARRLIEDARADIAALTNAAADDVIFTSGGTEAANLALNSHPQDTIVVSAVEHSCVLQAVPDAPRVAVDGNGVIDLDDLDARLAAIDGPSLVACMAANNETGVLQPVADVVAVARRHDARVFVDAVQAAGRIAVDFAAWDVDYLSLSAHKIGGPAGVGALVVRPGAPVHPLVRGGGQQGGRRGGTENRIGIAGFGAAARAVMDQGAVTSAFRDRIEAGLLRIAPDAVIFAHGAPRLSNTTCFAVPGLSGETALIALDLDGIAASSGAACSSGKVAPSPVLQAMDVDADLIGGAVRLSTGWSTTDADVERFIAAFEPLCGRLRAGARNESPALAATG